MPALVYGVAAYALALAASLYLVGFVGNLGVPRSIDAGPTAGPVLSLAVDVALIVVFGLQHSVMARGAFKARWTRAVPPPAERSTYVLATTLALALLLWQWHPVTQPVVWQVDSAGGARAIQALFWLGWAVVATSTFLIDHLDLFGLAQPLAALGRRPVAEPRLRTPGLYRYVRHPLYLGFLMAFWATPVMTAGHLVFALGMTAYVLIGVAFEERDLVARFGNRYRAYRSEVGMIVPWRKANAKRPRQG